MIKLIIQQTKNIVYWYICNKLYLNTQKYNLSSYSRFWNKNRSILIDGAN